MCQNLNTFHIIWSRIYLIAELRNEILAQKSFNFLDFIRTEREKFYVASQRLRGSKLEPRTEKIWTMLM